MKISYALALLAVSAAASAASSSPSSEGQKTAVVSPQVPPPVSSYPGPAAVQYPAHGYQFAQEYNSPPFAAKSAFAPKAAVPSPYAGPYQQPYQQQQYNFGPYQHYFPASGYPVAGAYPTAYSSQSATVTPYYYPTPYSAYPYAAQPYHGGSYSPYPVAFQSYNGQFVATPSASPYGAQYSSAAHAAPSAAPYSALPPSAYQPQQPQSSFHDSETANQFRQYSPFQDYSQSSQQFPSQQYLHSQQYPSFYPNSPKTANPVATDSAKVSAAEKK